jgi:prevent-host-death family protein
MLKKGLSMQVSIRELKAHLSRYVKGVRDGQSFEITSHRKVVARVVGVPQSADGGLERLLATGAATWSGGKPVGASLRLSTSLGTKGTPVSQIVLEDRG